MVQQLSVVSPSSVEMSCSKQLKKEHCYCLLMCSVVLQKEKGLLPEPNSPTCNCSLRHTFHCCGQHLQWTQPNIHTLNSRFLQRKIDTRPHALLDYCPNQRDLVTNTLPAGPQQRHSLPCCTPMPSGIPVATPITYLSETIHSCILQEQGGMK